MKNQISRKSYRSDVKQRVGTEIGMEAYQQGINILEVNADHSVLPILARNGHGTRVEYKLVQPQYMVDIPPIAQIIEKSPPFAILKMLDGGAGGGNWSQYHRDSINITSPDGDSIKLIFWNHWEYANNPSLVAKYNTTYSAYEIPFGAFASNSSTVLCGYDWNYNKLIEVIEKLDGDDSLNLPFKILSYFDISRDSVDEIRFTLKEYEDENLASLQVQDEAGGNLYLQVIEEYYSEAGLKEWVKIGDKNYIKEKPQIFYEDKRVTWSKTKDNTINQTDYLNNYMNSFSNEKGLGNFVSKSQIIPNDYIQNIVNNVYIDSSTTDIGTKIASDLLEIKSVPQDTSIKYSGYSNLYIEQPRSITLSNRLFSKGIITPEDSLNFLEEIENQSVKIKSIFQQNIFENDTWLDHKDLDLVPEINPIEKSTIIDVGGRRKNLYDDLFYNAQELHPHGAFDQHLFQTLDFTSINKNSYDLRDVSNSDVPFQDMKTEKLVISNSLLNSSALIYQNEWDLDLTDQRFSDHPFDETKKYISIDAEFLQVITNYKINNQQAREEVFLANEWLAPELIHTPTGYSSYQSEPCQGIGYNELYRR